MLTKHKAIVIVLVLGLLLAQTITVQAQLVEEASMEISPFITYDQVQAAMTWQVISDEYEEVLAGTFQAYFPNTFVFTHVDEDNYTQRFIGYQGVTAIHSQGGQVQYDYNQSQLFRVYEELFVPLAYMLDIPGDRMENTTLVGRTIHRYRTDTTPYLIYWLDAETGLPLRVEVEGGTEYLQLRKYTINPERDGLIESVSLGIQTDHWEGLIQIDLIDDHWFPSEIHVGDEQAEIRLEFTNWELIDEPLEFDTLRLLADSIKEGRKAYSEQDYEVAIDQFRQALRIDPYYSLGYFYLAYGYGILENYLGAVESYQQWLMLEPKNPLALNNLAYTYMLAEVHLDDAIAMAKEAVALDRQGAYLDTLGYGYYLRKEYDKAIPILLEAAEELTESALIEVYQHLVLVYEALDEGEQVEFYQQIIARLLSGD